MGMLVWTIGMLLPMFSNIQEFSLPWFDYTYVLDDRNWHFSAIAALTTNCLTFVLVSLLTRTSSEEQRAAQACVVNNVRRPERRELLARTAQQFVAELSKPLGAVTAQREVEQAMQDLQLPFDERRPFALRRLRDRIEAN